jgi:hypothetical protein
VRWFLSVLLAAAFFALFAPAAPVPKHLMRAGPVYYYPTTPGTKWVYDQRTTYVDRVEDVRGAKVVTVVTVDAAGAKAVDEVMEVSEAGIARLSCGGPRFDAPLVLLQAPFHAGTTWEIKTSGAEGTGTIVGTETIEVPAGKF